MSEPFIGEIRMVGFNFAPRGWAFCQGQLLPIAQNQALFSLLGTTYGGDGRSTFALPDLRGRSPVGQGHGPGLSDIRIGEQAGTESVTLTQAQMPSHSHSAEASVAIPANSSSTDTNPAPASNTVLGPASNSGRAGALYTTDAANTTLAPFNNPVNVQPAGGNQSVGIRNPMLGMNFIIALEGIFPPRN
ncbi:tail Collar domain-containing protein [Marinobacterium nitratireducens]|uniref:Tail Collar domain-containing protein n=1 Tax=Marinobacterium nitratireducens TaxID=518897 RepID=A0A917ZFG9_9GAMM|nr:tail fiber protein [Marinobacterium nitratireducens]GGO81517.1 tail Collar domain-containing protein [Marinobacterium nitratireducens]